MRHIAFSITVDPRQSHDGKAGVGSCPNIERFRGYSEYLQNLMFGHQRFFFRENNSSHTTLITKNRMSLFAICRNCLFTNRTPLPSGT
jgi:hypothetical protein